MLAAGALVLGIILLALSAERFVEGAALTARRMGIPPLLVGILVMGFGSSLPEMVISVLAALDGNTGLALGNAMGSNISNIALILGLTAVLSPIAVRSSVLARELPVLLLVTGAGSLLLWLGADLARMDGVALMVLFVLLMGWSIHTGLRAPDDELAGEVEHALAADQASAARALVYMIGGLVVLVISSRLLVWGGVGLARELGVSDLVIGLTVVALGTSLPELAASIVAVRRNEHDLAIGNVIGSNLFNTSIVIGLAGILSPIPLESGLLGRDVPAVILFTGLLFLFCYPMGGRQPHINRKEGALLLAGYCGYYAWLLWNPGA